MKNSTSRASISRYLIAIITLAWLISFLLIADGWRKTQLQLSDQNATTASRLLTLTELMEETQLSFQLEVHEWKDILLRHNDPTLLAHHLQGFHQASLDTRDLMKASIIVAQEEHRQELVHLIEDLLRRHAFIDQTYATALLRLNPRQPLSYLDVDRGVLGIDRDLSRRITLVQNKFSRKLFWTAYLIQMPTL